MFSLSHDRKNISDDDLINDLRAVAHELGVGSVKERDYRLKGRYGVTTVIRRFGSWAQALSVAGLEKAKNTKITKDALFDNLEEVWIQLGRQPTYKEIQKPLSRFHVASYERKFGSWRMALEEFVSHIESEVNVEQKPSDASPSEKIKRTSRTVNLRVRFLVMSRDRFKCVACGRSPAIELGVVLQVDHIKPWSAGGETVIDNLQTLCFECNQGKSNLMDL